MYLIAGRSQKETKYIQPFFHEESHTYSDTDLAAATGGGAGNSAEVSQLLPWAEEAPSPLGRLGEEQSRLPPRSSRCCNLHHLLLCHLPAPTWAGPIWGTPLLWPCSLPLQNHHAGPGRLPVVFLLWEALGTVAPHPKVRGCHCSSLFSVFTEILALRMLQRLLLVGTLQKYFILLFKLILSVRFIHTQW